MGPHVLMIELSYGGWAASVYTQQTHIREFFGEENLTSIFWGVT